MKARVIEVEAGNLEEGLKKAMEQIAKDIAQEVEGGDNLLTDTIEALEAVKGKVSGTLQHIEGCENCAKHTERTAALETCKSKMEAAVTALQEVIKAEKAVNIATKNARGVN